MHVDNVCAYLFVFMCSYTYSVLANLLAPKITLCDKEFELTVDNLVFVGYPMFATYQPKNGKITEHTKLHVSRKSCISECSVCGVLKPVFLLLPSVFYNSLFVCLLTNNQADRLS